uniref:Ammonium transporter n=1 Tax=Funneliformis coronatus TaxID=1117309 RepID=A0A1M4NES1_9GLOM|nr:Ammonium transporter [Funneliformis coronatus]
MGGLDFAGGTPVHIASGAAALAYCIIVGKRHGHGTDELNHITLQMLFLELLYFGSVG